MQVCVYFIVSFRYLQKHLYISVFIYLYTLPMRLFDKPLVHISSFGSILFISTSPWQIPKAHYRSVFSNIIGIPVFRHDICKIGLVFIILCYYIRLSVMASSNGNIFRVTGNWVNNREAGALKHHRPYYEVTVIKKWAWYAMLARYCIQYDPMSTPPNTDKLYSVLMWMLSYTWIQRRRFDKYEICHWGEYTGDRWISHAKCH